MAYSVLRLDLQDDGQGVSITIRKTVTNNMAVHQSLALIILIGGLLVEPLDAAAQDAASGNGLGAESEGPAVQEALLEIDWSAAYAYAGATEQEYANLSGTASQKLYPGADTCYMPVLIPPDGETVQLSSTYGIDAVADEIPGLRRMVFKAYDDSYAATLALDSAVVMVNGSRIAYATPRIGPDISANDYLVSTTESGIEMSFSKFGASYFMSIECDDPSSDDRCTDQEFIMTVYEKLQLVGGMSSGG